VRLAAKLHKVLRHAIRPLSPNAVVQVRVKSMSSFAEKVLRKRDLRRDPINQFTDLCGARVITHLKSEVDAVCRFITAHFAVDATNGEDTAARLKSKEFGYRSIHFIAQFKANVFPNEKIPVNVPEELHALKAEIQVRTFLQHAWADMDHDRLYRSSFKVPEQYVRELARLAAAMESADEAFGRLAANLEALNSKHVGYVPPLSLNQQPDILQQEIEIFQLVRKYAPADERLAQLVARLLANRQEWPRIIDLLQSFPGVPDAGLLTCLGHALCQQYAASRKSAEYLRGRRLLEQATKLEPGNVEAYIRLAESWIGERPKRALDYYAQAFAADPADPEALCGYVRYKIAAEQNLSFLALLRPAIRAAFDKCRAHAEAGINVPWALYRMAELGVLLGPDHELASLNAYLQAISASSSKLRRRLLEDALEGLNLFEPVEQQLATVGTARRLVLLARAARYAREEPETLRELHEVATGAGKPVEPVVIVVGGCDPAFQRHMEGYRELLLDAFRSFRGTLLSGGTIEGISGLVGELGQAFSERIKTIGYVPEHLPTDGSAVRDERYHEMRRTSARTGFSVLEPLQSWIDLLDAGVAPEAIRVLGINGGNIAAFEYRLALLLGARVGVVRDSGRKADALGAEAELEPIPGLALLPADRRTLEAFVTVDMTNDLSTAQRLYMAQRIHEDYRAKNRPRQPLADPVLKPWDELDPMHQKANLHQANDYQRKLAAIGKTAVPVQGRDIQVYELTPAEIELLAEMEHGRWVIQRLLDGWTLGPRNEQEKQRPSLVGWHELHEEDKRKDRESVQNLPRLLMEIGFEIRSAE
jgi:ppGpp synthetase/RelA/SpoT-type nucleotidyltranferase